MLLRIENLNVYFPLGSDEKQQVVHSLNFEINQSQVLGIIGESGSGKSVATQVISGLIPSAEVSGKAWFNNESSETDLLSLDASARRQVLRSDIAYIFQEPMTALNPLIRCGKQIEESLRSRSKEKVYELLLRVELTDVERIYQSFPHELSGGQRQRIMIAMALAKEPKLLIADEPTTALDIAVQSGILQLLKAISIREKLGIIFITHDILSLRGFADHILVLYQGKVQEYGPCEEIMERPQSSYTKALLESRATYAKKGKYLLEVDEIINQTTTPEKLPAYKRQEGSPIVEIRGLSKSYSEGFLLNKKISKVINDINIEINRGDIFGLIGESGSGKSTIARILLRLLKADQGKILIAGTEFEKIKSLPSKIQLVFQDPYSSLNPKQRIGPGLREVLRLRNETDSKEAAIELLITVGLNAADYQKFPHEFSGGQRQRICIARALARRPEILVLDESVSALDVSIQAKILNLLNELKAQYDLTYILISHDMNVISYFCNRIAVLKDGTIIEAGNTDELITQSRNTYTRTLLDHSIH
jgi:peptide/nickel transport system ATP-binding protein